MSHASSHGSTALRTARNRWVPYPRRESDTAGPGSRPHDSLQKVRRIGLAVLGLKFLGFCAWSLLLYRRFALTPDFAQYQQAWYLIAHGNLNPYDTVREFRFLAESW